MYELISVQVNGYLAIPAIADFCAGCLRTDLAAPGAVGSLGWPWKGALVPGSVAAFGLTAVNETLPPRPIFLSICCFCCKTKWLRSFQIKRFL